MRALLRRLAALGVFLGITGMAAATFCYDTASSTQTYCLTESYGNADWNGVGLHEYFTGPPRCSVGLDYFGQQKELAATVAAPTGAPRDYAYVYAFDALNTQRGQTSALFSAIVGGEIRAYPTMIYSMGYAGIAGGTMEDQINTNVPLTATYSFGTATGVAFLHYDLTSSGRIVAPPSVDLSQPFEVRAVVNPIAWPSPSFRWTSSNGSISPTPSLLQRSFSSAGWRTFTVVVRSPSRADSMILTKLVNVLAPCSGGSAC